MAITINLVQFGAREEMELEEGSTAQDVVDRLPNAEGQEVRSRGEDLRENPDQPVEDGQTVNVSPRLKNGE